jgi:integrase
MPYRPIQTMNNTAWQNAREKAGPGDLHVHDLRHTVGLRLRLREAGASDRTQDAILWHSCKTMTAHYSMAQLVEVFEALEKIKDEANRWNISLTGLIHEANVERLTQKSPTQRQTG